MNGMSETGNFLGRIVLSGARQTSFALKQIRQTWYRANMEPFLEAATGHPFFFAWKPTEFPGDVGYVTMSNDPQPSREFDTGRMALTLQMNGVAV
jgi:hypothetical protein